MIRSPAVAGMFYPGNPDELEQTIATYLQDCKPDNKTPKAMIVPHAGYIYSGPVAAKAFSTLIPFSGAIKRVVLLGPSHRVAFDGVAASSADAFATPLGDIKLDSSSIESLQQGGLIIKLDEAHQMEHSLEVELPFLQTVLNSFKLVPLVVGDADPEAIAKLLDIFYDDPETLIVISSDLSHYLDYESAKSLDQKTATAIEHFDSDQINNDQACGRTPVAALLLLAKKHQMNVKRVDLRNSGDTAGSKDQVVGYGAWVFYPTGEDTNNAG